MIINGNKFPLKLNKAALLIERSVSAWNWKDSQFYSEIARGIRKPFLVFKNANVFMAHSGEFCKGDVAVEDGIVIGVGEYEGETEIDLDGKYLVRDLLTATFIWNRHW